MAGAELTTAIVKLRQLFILLCTDIDSAFQNCSPTWKYCVKRNFRGSMVSEGNREQRNF